MSKGIEDQVNAYLDGDLDGDAARALEMRFADPEVQGALTRELALRDWLGHVGPEAPPPDLVRELEAAVVAELGSPEADGLSGISMVSSIRGVLAGFGWMARGPAVAVGTSSGAAAGLGFAARAARRVPGVPARGPGRSDAPRGKRPLGKTRRLAAWGWRRLRGK